MSKEKKIHIVKSVIKHGLLLCVGFFWIYPFLWMISASFKGQNEFFQNRMGLIPVQPTIDNFIRIWQKADFGTYFINTIIVTAFSVIIVLIMTMMAGYAMGRYKFLGRNLCMAVFLASIAIPLVSTIIPTYEVVKGMNLVGTKLGLILSQAGGAHVIFLLLFTSFFQSVPNELEEASKIDGCSDAKFFFRIVLPLSRTILAVLGIMYMSSHWNAYFNAFLYLKDRDLFPLQLFLRQILVQSNFDSQMLDPEAVAQMQTLQMLLKYSVIVIATAPMLCLFPFFQKYFDKGILIGSLKG